MFTQMIISTNLVSDDTQKVHDDQPFFSVAKENNFLQEIQDLSN